jgi:hypothetical protein
MCIIDSTMTCTGTCTPAGGAGCRMNSDCPADQQCGGGAWEGPGFWLSGGCNPLVPPGATAGDLCGNPVACAPGLFCAGGPAPARCAAGPGPGEPCGSQNPGSGCAPGLACTPSDDGKALTCMPEAKLGDPCTSLFQCGAQYRLSNIICDVNGSHTCVHRPSTGPCVLVERTNSCDPVIGFCDGTAGAATCRPWFSVGEPCVFPIFPTQGLDPCGPGAGCQGAVGAARCTLEPECFPT